MREREKIIRISDQEGFHKRIETRGNQYSYQQESNGNIHKNLNFNDDGGGGSMNFVSHEQFNEYKDHVSTRFDNVDEKLDRIEKDTSSTKGNVKWLIGIAAASGVTMIIGFITIIANLV